MPFYVYECQNKHQTEVFCQIVDRKDEICCGVCEMPSRQLVTPPRVNGGQISEKTRDLLRAPFGRKRADNFRTVKDVDKALDEFKQKYGPMTGEPGRSDDDRA